jgi:HK97 family phage major capsid protein
MPAPVIERDIDAPAPGAFPAYDDVCAKIKAKAGTLATVFAEAGPEIDMSKVKTLDGDSRAKTAAIRTLNDELTALGTERDEHIGVWRAAQAAKRYGEDNPVVPNPHSEPGAGPGAPQGFKSIGDAFVESKAYKGRSSGNNSPVDSLDFVELKTLFQTTAGWAPETTRGPRLIESVQRPIQVIDVIPQNSTNQAAVVYMEETTFTNNAAEIAEGGTYAESALALTQRTSPVQKVGTWIPITDEQLEDVAQCRGYLNNRLPFMVRQRLDSQLLVGNGTAPNLRGILNVVGIQTQAKGADPVPDAVYKAMVLVMVTGAAMPDAYITNPTDWQDVKLLRTADGIYIWGSPTDPGPDRIWGLRVVLAQAMTLNTGLVGDFQNFSEFALRRGMDVQISNSHSTFFVEGKQAVRADIRGALVVYRPTAFCSVTGI